MSRERVDPPHLPAQHPLREMRAPRRRLEPVLPSREVVAAVMEEAATIIGEDTLAWTARCAAENDKGEACSPRDPAAVRFCGWGALGAALKRRGVQLPNALAIRQLVRQAVLWVYAEDLTQVNATRGPRAVQRVFRSVVEAMP